MKKRNRQNNSEYHEIIVATKNGGKIREIREILNTLPFEYREVITLCSIQGLTFEEAAKIIGCSDTTVWMRLNKAKKIFMNKLGIEPEGS